MARKLLLLVPVVLVLLFIGGHAFLNARVPDVDLPVHEPVEVVYLDQNWSDDDRQWFYHASQGGSMELPIPYEWLMALERPTIPPLFVTEVGLLMAPDYIARFGFLPNDRQRYRVEGLSEGWWAPDGFTKLPEDTLNNEARLPVGFALTRDWLNERTGRRSDVVGFTCAACHVGQLNYRGTGMRIDGGPALTDLGKFRLAVGEAMGLTDALPPRFSRFADRVLGPDRTDAATDSLRTELEGLIQEGVALKAIVDSMGIYPVEEGFGRLDAIGRIGNFVFAEELDPRNFAVADAPVNFPHIWDTPWLDWVQYNASFSQPMMRNAGEAMGVFASVNFDSIGSEELLFSSTIDVVNLHEMEGLIRGAAPYTGLRSPDWPEDILGGLDPALVARGEALYRSTCEGCHKPPLTDSAALFDDAHWTEPDPDDPAGHRYLKVTLVNLWDIGTDPKAAENFYRRTVQLGPLGREFADTLAVGGMNMGGVVTAGAGLPFLIRKSAEKRYRDIGLPDSLWSSFDGNRPAVIQAPLAYKARPLNGVWATPPFLHNGSVPTIDHLLGPEEDRPERFWLGSKEYDPERVGYVWDEVEGGFHIDTRIPGNSNRGHRFCGARDAADPPWIVGCPPPGDPDGARSTRGVVGPALDADERRAILEFLKSLPGAPRSRPSGG